MTQGQLGAAPDAVAIDRYMDGLRAKVNDFAYPSATIETRASKHNGLLAIALEVKRSEVPVSLRLDHRIFERRGSSNVAVALADWRANRSPSDGSRLIAGAV